jgi:hypothetical protein
MKLRARYVFLGGVLLAASSAVSAGGVTAYLPTK